MKKTIVYVTLVGLLVGCVFAVRAVAQVKEQSMGEVDYANFQASLAKVAQIDAEARLKAQPFVMRATEILERYHLPSTDLQFPEDARSWSIDPQTRVIYRRGAKK